MFNSYEKKNKSLFVWPAEPSGCRSLPVDPMIGLDVRTNTTMGKQLNADTTSTYCGYFWNESFFSMDNDISRISSDYEL